MRPVEERDTDALVALFADPALGRFHRRDLTSPDQVRQLAAIWRGLEGPAGTGVHVIERDEKVVGVAHLSVSTELPGDVLECGWYLAREHWGTGLATEVATTLLTTGFTIAPAVFALVHEDNVRARRFGERLGFVDVGGGLHYGGQHRVLVALPVKPSGVHHVELWVADLATAEKTFGWLFTELGWHEYQRWERGVSWRQGDNYVVVEDSPARAGDRHERLAPGINHLALHAGSRADVDRVTAAARDHGWQLMFADRHPHAGGPDHYAAYLENADGFEVELVARP
ncbi:GNAT family N-acetyltransferase [Actinophytocola oryzae]|uniref:RimJ/RimL family protein N-acetyltransferase n=1 Tax=Actinophytocola oryzae TaxID=502181 RepID=A0A4R7VHZ6_9PSEU|nr:GNAT family N-acetyltransferase [Actinophytocola oryzae]TDV48972.1 RimJ/RimL family protein N-acetyltransferase [Actinophytocola oryzae]